MALTHLVDVPVQYNSFGRQRYKFLELTIAKATKHVKHYLALEHSLHFGENIPCDDELDGPVHPFLCWSIFPVWLQVRKNNFQACGTLYVSTI